jgi:nitroreductase
MDFSELIQARYSVRSYQSTAVAQEKLNRILAAAQAAPTACNRQPFQLIVMHTEGRQAELARIYHRPWFVQAPLIIGICGIPAQTWVRKDGKNYNDVDVSIAFDHLVLAAANEGLGTCWVANFDVDAAREVLGLPQGVEPIAFTPLGYASDQPPPRTRKPLDSLVRWERW